MIFVKKQKLRRHLASRLPLQNQSRFLTFVYVAPGFHEEWPWPVVSQAGDEFRNTTGFTNPDLYIRDRCLGHPSPCGDVLINHSALQSRVPSFSIKEALPPNSTGFTNPDLYLRDRLFLRHPSSWGCLDFVSSSCLHWSAKVKAHILWPCLFQTPVWSFITPLSRGIHAGDRSRLWSPASGGSSRCAKCQNL